MTEKPLEGRVTLVTGATRGIGYAAAIALADAGSHIIALGRTQGGLEQLDDAISTTGGETTLVPMDLKNGDGIDHLGSIINDRWGKLDGFFANAAILGDISPAPHITPKSWNDVFAINVTANYRLIRSLDPLLRLSPAGRALFVTSGVATSRRAFWGAYAASKAALEGLVQCWAKEVEVTNMRVNLVNPGATRTAMRAKAMPGENPVSLPGPEDVAPLIVEMLGPDYLENDQIVNYRDTAHYSPK